MEWIAIDGGTRPAPDAEARRGTSSHESSYSTSTWSVVIRFLAVAAVPRVKGVAVREMLRWYAQQTSREELRRIVMGLPPELRAPFDPDSEAIGVLASNWYESASVNALIDAMLLSMPPGKRHDAIRSAAQFAMEASTRSIYRFVLARLTPDAYARNIQRLWNLMHDTGIRDVVMTSEDSCISICRDWPGHSANFCLATIESMCAMLSLMGCKDITARRVACVSRGARECVTEVEWTRPRPPFAYPSLPVRTR